MPAAFALSAMTWIAVIQSDHPFGHWIVRSMSEPSLFSTYPSSSVSL